MFCELMIFNGHVAQVKYFLALTMLLDKCLHIEFLNVLSLFSVNLKGMFGWYPKDKVTLKAIPFELYNYPST